MMDYNLPAVFCPGEIGKKMKKQGTSAMCEVGKSLLTEASCHTEVWVMVSKVQ